MGLQILFGLTEKINSKVFELKFLCGVFLPKVK